MTYAEAVGLMFDWSVVDRWAGRMPMDHRLTIFLYHRDLPHGACLACRYGYAGHAKLVADAILAFVAAITKEYDLTSDEDIVVEGKSASVFPMNPPYRKVRYLAPFIETLERMLESCGFEYVDRQNYRFEGHGLTVCIENVDVSNPEETEPIQVDFFEA